MMFDFGCEGAAEEAVAPPAGQPEAGAGDRTQSPRRPACLSPETAVDPVGEACQAAEDEYDRSEVGQDPVLGQDAVTALLPVLKDISRQFCAYTEAMETAVRDLAETENDLQTELQHMVRQSKQVLAAHGELRHRFTERLGKVSRCLRAQQSPASSQQQ